MKARASAVLLAACLFATTIAAQLPAISWTCPMHPDVLEDKKGACHICGMDLEAVRLVSMYTCPVHAVIEQSEPGKCRICSRDLVTMTAALTFTCKANPDVNQLEPGKCDDGSAMVPRYTRRAHGDHNPKHGGIFFMASDNWHHFEGTYPAPGRFRAYVYDDYSRPLSQAAARTMRGRLVTKEAFDPKTGTTREVAAVPLVLARDGAYFEARLDHLPLPAKITVKFAFRPGDKENRFDFVFPQFSRDLPAPVQNRTKNVSPPALPAASTPAASIPAASTANAASSSLDTLLADLRARTNEVDGLVTSGSFGGVFFPALAAKDIALEIQARLASNASVNQDAVEASVKQIVLAAYELDNYGDLGDGEKVHEAYRTFSRAVSALEELVSRRSQ